MKTSILFICTCFSFIFSALAQVAYVSGNVSSKEGVGLPGVSVAIEGTTQATLTDLDGHYSIVVPGSGVELIFSSIGFLTQVIPVGDQTMINIVMSPDIKMLRDVVVTGYITQSMRNVSGSISKLDLKQLQMIPTNNLADQLQGMAPGVMVLNTGQPGGAVDVRIRGFTTINNNSPLYVIDGNPTTDAYRFLNPGDVESIQILKDASAASIYGARAGNGVIIITTKKPKLGETQFSFDAYTGVQTVPATLPEFLNPSELAEVTKIAYQNAGRSLSDNSQYYLEDESWGLPDYMIPNGYSESLSGPLDISDYNYKDPAKRYTRANKQGTDWMNEIFSPAFFQNYNFNLSVGSEKGSVALSAGYLDRKGILKYNDFQKFTFRVNSSINLSKKIRIGEDLSFAFEKGLPDVFNKQALEFYPNSAISYAYRMPSIVPVYDTGGNFAGTEGAPDLGRALNPLGWLERNVKGNYETWLNLMGSIFLEADILEGLTFKSNFSPTIIMLPEYKNFYWIYPDDYGYNDQHTDPSLNGDPDLLHQVNKYSYNWSWYNTLTFERTFHEKHNLKLLIGTEAIYNKYMYTNVYRTGYFKPDKNSAEIDNGLAVPWGGVDGTTQEWAMFSLFARADYDISGKYILSATIRRDGSSRFGSDNRYGYFPAISAAWRISDENFMKGISLINDLKLRASWGQTGNQDIKVTGTSDRYSQDIFIDVSGYDISGQQNSVESGAFRVFIGNPDIKWETTTTINIGLDASFFNNHITAGIDLYSRKTTDLLELVLPPATLGFSYNLWNLPNSGYYYVNTGSTMENKGLDLALMYHSQVSGNFKWNIGVNYSFYKNMVDFVYNTPESYTKGYSKRGGLPNINFGNSVTQKGNPIASFNGYLIEGIFQDSIDVMEHAKQPRYDYTTADNDSVFMANTSYWIGRWKFVDSDSNGVIDSRDRTILGSPHPDFILGIPISLNFKQFELNLFFYGAFGHEIYNYTKFPTDLIGMGYNGEQKSKRILQSWGMPGVNGSNAILPQVNVNAPIIERAPNSYYIEDASFLRLRQITLGYNFNTEKWHGIKKCHMYLQATNLFTLTHYTGMDPMVSVYSDTDLEIGVDYAQYPTSASFIIGLNLTF